LNSAPLGRSAPNRTATTSQSSSTIRASPLRSTQRSLRSKVRMAIS
jgi:hypothetical protein